jgi:hypothetical protein
MQTSWIQRSSYEKKILLESGRFDGETNTSSQATECTTWTKLEYLLFRLQAEFWDRKGRNK